MKSFLSITVDINADLGKKDYGKINYTSIILIC